MDTIKGLFQNHYVHAIFILYILSFFNGSVSQIMFILASLSPNNLNDFAINICFLE